MLTTPVEAESEEQRISFLLRDWDFRTPTEEVRKDAEMGDATAQFNLGLKYDNGKGVAQDYVEAAKWYRKAADQGLKEAQFNLGMMCDKGDGVVQDYAEAAKWYQQAADQGLDKAQFNLGLKYNNGQGVAQDYVEAAKWYRKAADEYLDKAQFNLGLKYNSGEGVVQDYVQALLLMTLAVALANGDDRKKRYAAIRDRVAASMNPTQIAESDRLARERADEDGDPDFYLSVRAAIPLSEIRRLAEEGDPGAQRALGEAYANGQGVPQTYAEMVKWYRKDGVPQNYTEAAKWYRKAAERGDADAQGDLGYAYAKGQGIPQDYAEAVLWWRKAAEQGNASAQDNLGVSYNTGQGVLQDYMQAHMWLSLAASSSSGEDQKRRAKARDDVAKKLTAQQLAEAQRMAREWRPTN